MEPTNDYERSIAQKVDEKFLEDSGDCHHVIIGDVAESLDFVMSASDSQFYILPVALGGQQQQFSCRATQSS